MQQTVETPRHGYAETVCVGSQILRRVFDTLTWEAHDAESPVDSAYMVGGLQDCLIAAFEAEVRKQFGDPQEWERVQRLAAGAHAADKRDVESQRAMERMRRDHMAEIERLTRRVEAAEAELVTAGMSEYERGKAEGADELDEAHRRYELLAGAIFWECEALRKLGVCQEWIEDILIQHGATRVKPTALDIAKGWDGLRGVDVPGFSLVKLERTSPYTFAEYSATRLKAQGEGRDALTRRNVGALGLCGEAGEYSELIKKHHYHGKPLDKERAVKELGDVLWYVMYAADSIGSSLEEVARTNDAKLRERYPNGFSVEAAAKVQAENATGEM